MFDDMKGLTPWRSLGLGKGATVAELPFLALWGEDRRRRLETTALPIVSLVIALVTSYYFGTQFAVSWNATHVAQITPFIGGIYGTTLATMGMLAVMGMVLALDGFGPIADNAAGIAEMSGEGGAESTMEALDAVGNTTKALTKGFALGSALLAAQLLFQTYASEVSATRLTRVKLLSWTSLTQQC